jgi:hypothetical protein
MAKVFIATPMYGGQCSGTYTKSLISLMAALQNAGHQVSFTDLYNESLITRARNTLTELFLKTDSDYLLFIDADQGFSAQGVVKMVEENVDIIGAAVPMKAINWGKVKAAMKDGRDDLQNHTAYYNINLLNKDDLNVLKDNPTQLIEVSTIGTGLLLIHRRVFEALIDIVGTYTSDQLKIGNIEKGDSVHNFWQTVVDPESKRLLSEDYYFCKLWRDLGNKVLLAPYVKVTHMGSYIFQ